jgi:type IV secretory pathway protease TraF
MDRHSATSLLLIRRTVGCAVASLLILMLARISSIQGIVRRVSIEGPSMATQLCGTHFQVTCADCKFTFACDAEHQPADKLAACPNCGYTKNALEQAQLHVADRVVIDGWTLLWSAPKRGDVMAIKLPDSGDLAVKRIAALPGERLAIHDGDLLVDGQILRKTPVELQAVQLLVHDHAYRPQPTAELPARWRPLAEATMWEATPRGFRAAPANTGDAIDWLQYEHWKCTADARSRGVTSPVTDNDSYNQGETRRPLNAVTDIFLSCRVSTAGQGELFLAATAGDQRFEAIIDPESNLTLRQGDRTLARQRLRTNFSRRFTKLEFGLCDQQIFLVIDGRTHICHPYEFARDPRAEPLHPLAIGTRGLPIEINDLRVWRDIYYLDSLGLNRLWELSAPLGSSEYALLGDNQPVSIDSRQWQPTGIPRSAILGHVYRPFWATFRRLD